MDIYRLFFISRSFPRMMNLVFFLLTLLMNQRTSHYDDGKSYIQLDVFGHDFSKPNDKRSQSYTTQTHYVAIDIQKFRFR